MKKFMEKFNDTLSNYFNREKHRDKDILKRSMVCQAYPFAVGKILARTTKVLNFRYGTLIVACRNSIYIVELTRMKHEMISKINSIVGEKSVKDIRFVLGDRRYKKPQKKKKKLSKEQTEWIEKVASAAPDCYRAEIRSMLIACKENE
ncbi:MAG: DUF721 domain-containing protein [Caldisericia bacterium]|nr:DUF721 domain-containing protein [Caldisericia bacterium]